MNFEFLSIAQVAALSDEDRATYEAALTKFVAKFQEANPEGIAEVSARVVNISALPKMSRGKMRVAMVVKVADATIASAVTGTNGVIQLAPTQADVIAQNAGFFTWGHMAITTTGCFNKGSFNLSVKLNIKGETWTSRDGSTGVYRSTHLAIAGYDYLPSPEVSGKINVATAKVIESGYANLMNASVVETAKPQPVVADVEDTTEDTDDVNP